MQVKLQADQTLYDPAAPDLGALQRKLANLQKIHKEASDEASAAGRRATTALNDLNEAQRELNQAIGRLKKEAPRESDWQREINRPHEVVRP